jgi:hypothetical protein
MTLPVSSCVIVKSNPLTIMASITACGGSKSVEVTWRDVPAGMGTYSQFSGGGSGQL